MTTYDAIVNPVRSKNAPDIGPVAVMAATEMDLFSLCDLFKFNRDDYHRLFTSRLYIESSGSGISLTGPFIGAPYAAMMLETIIAWGARRILFLGWCGAVSKQAKIGDIILPTSALVDEGTSRNYAVPHNGQSKPASVMVSLIEQVLEDNRVDVHSGKIWTTDAVYRETKEKVDYYQKQGVLAVEMEASALFSVAQFRQVELCAVLVVSDELSTLSWKQGFRSEQFLRGRQVASKIILRLCRVLADH
ncbi:MAG: nucleoside phosphorylase [Desulfobacterales bacterium]